MYFSQTDNEITDLVTGKIHTLPSPGTAGYSKSKAQVIETAKRLQESALNRIRSVTARNFYTVEQLASEYARVHVVA